MGWGMDGGLGVGLGPFFVGFRGRVRVGDTIWGVINNRGNIRICLRFFVYLPCRPLIEMRSYI